MLRSARGNSGVILSVFFRGVGRALKGKTAATAADLAAGFAVGAESAYGAVMNPTEGTILTVMRAAADCAKQVAKLDPESDLEAFFAAVLTAADGALQKTPDLLPKLKEAGVVDAGGCGFLDILSAMDEALNRAEDVLEVQHGTPAPSAAPAPLAPPPPGMRRRSSIPTAPSASSRSPPLPGGGRRKASTSLWSRPGTAPSLWTTTAW